MPSASVTEATAASTAASSETSATAVVARTPSVCDLGHQRGQVVAGGRAVRRRLVVGPRDVDHPDVGAAPGQLQRRGPADAAGSRRTRHQGHLARERASSGSVCETHRANVAGGAPSEGWVRYACRGDEGWAAGGGRGPRTRAVLGPRRRPLARRRHLRVRPARAGRLLPLHRVDGLGGRPRARPGGRLRVRPRVLRRDRGARPRHRRHAAGGHPGLLGAHHRGTDRGRADRLLQRLPRCAGRAHGAPGAALPAGARRARHRPRRADRAARRGRARRGPGRPHRGPAVSRRRVRAGRAGRHRRPEGAGPRPRARGRLLADPAPPRRGVRRRRGPRPGRGFAPRPLARLRHRPDRHGAHRCSGPP